MSKAFFIWDLLGEYSWEEEEGKNVLQPLGTHYTQLFAFKRYPDPHSFFLEGTA